MAHEPDLLQFAVPQTPIFLDLHLQVKVEIRILLAH